MTAKAIQRTTLRTLGVICLLAIAALIGAVSVDARTERVRAADWAADELAKGGLPTSLDDLESLPTTFRRAAFELMTAEEKSAVWQEQFTKIIAEPGLSDEQRALLVEYRALLVPAAYELTDSPATTAAKEAIRALCPKMVELFYQPHQRDDIRFRLRNLGISDVGDTQSATIRRFALAVQTTLGVATVNADLVPDCDCAEPLGACSCNSGELCKGITCTAIAQNCSCGGDVETCNFKCAIPAND